MGFICQANNRSILLLRERVFGAERCDFDQTVNINRIYIGRNVHSFVRSYVCSFIDSDLVRYTHFQPLAIWFWCFLLVYAAMCSISVPVCMCVCMSMVQTNFSIFLHGFRNFRKIIITKSLVYVPFGNTPKIDSKILIVKKSTLTHYSSGKLRTENEFFFQVENSSTAIFCRP